MKDIPHKIWKYLIDYKERFVILIFDTKKQQYNDLQSFKSIFRLS